MASPPPWLMEELIEEILLRLPPQEPASLVRAALVCKPWLRLVSDLRFQRRFREIHRTPPMLGFLCNHEQQQHKRSCSFVRTTPSSPLLLHHARRFRWCTLDARQGRVLLRDPTRNALAVWDPITDAWQELPFLPRWASSCTAAVLCAAGAGACADHHDCHLGSFLVVFVGTDPWNRFVCTYDSADYSAAWSEPISIHHPNASYIFSDYSSAVLLGNELYLGIPRTNTALQYDLDLRESEISWIQLPTLFYCYQRCVLTATEDGLGVVSLLNDKLCMWLRMDDTSEANAGWTQIKDIDLGMGRHVNPIFLPDACVVGFADGLDIVFVTVNAALFTVDLKTYLVKRVYTGRAIEAVFPYMRFHCPALEASYLGDEEQCS